jgi:uncharacterized protein (TIGR00369 family)
MATVDERAARAAFDEALQSHQPGFGTFFLARLLNLEISYPQGQCVIRFPIHDFLFNPQGSLHGGVIATIMDISMGHLLRQTYGAGGATLEMKLQYLRSVSGDHAWCQAQFLRKGRSVAFLESRLYDSANELAVFASSTWKPPSAPADTPNAK